MNYNHHHRREVMLPEPNKVVREDMKGYVPKLKLYLIGSGIGIAVCFISFILLPMSLMSRMSHPGSDFSFNFASVLIPFIGFAVFGFLSSYDYGRYRVGYAMLMVIEQIERTDKILIKNIDYHTGKSNNSTLYVIKLLMDTNNLPEYEIVEDTMVAKKSLSMSKKDVEKAIMPEVVVVNDKTVGYCFRCNNTLQAGDVFCSKCGTKN